MLPDQINPMHPKCRSQCDIPNLPQHVIYSPFRVFSNLFIYFLFTSFIESSQIIYSLLFLPIFWLSFFTSFGFWFLYLSHVLLLSLSLSPSNFCLNKLFFHYFHCSFVTKKVSCDDSCWPTPNHFGT